MNRSSVLVAIAAVGLLACAKKNDKDAAANGSAASATNGVPDKPTEGPQRPAWVTFDKPGTGECTDHAGELYCIGVSAPSADRNAAKQAASEVALDAMAAHLAHEATADKADATKPVARKEIEAALNVTPTTPPAPVDWYWEQYAKESGSGTEALGFARFALEKTARTSIAAKLAATK